VRVIRRLGVIIFAACLAGCSSPVSDFPPNIVYIMVDDLGYGDLGCYGSRINDTPNIDSLAREGIRFTDFHSNGPMCTPTRTAFITGKYQYRFGEKFERALDGTRHHDQGLPLETFTIGRALKSAGYSTAVFGKWHLGYQPPFLPLSYGFDEFVGLGSGDGDHHTHIDRSGRRDWWHGNQLDMEEGYSTDLITRHSVDFIKRNAGQPFFLYVSYLAIHFPWQGPEDPPHRQEGIDYHQDKWGIIPDRKNVKPHVKAMVESIDKGVGEIISALRQEEIEEDTLVIFTSDNGGYIDYKSGGFENISSNGPLRGQKTEVYEGGHRVPAIAWWPGRVPAGTENDNLVMTMDMLPTFAELADAGLPKEAAPDGISITGQLKGLEVLSARTACWKNGENRAIRQGDWKLCLIGDSRLELYNLVEDIGETRDLAEQHPELVEQLLEEYRRWETDVTSGYGELHRQEGMP